MVKALYYTAYPVRRCGSSVWSILQTISYGETTTYGDIGKQIAQQQD